MAFIRRRTIWRWALLALAMAFAGPAAAGACDSANYSGTLRLRHETLVNQPRVGVQRDETVASVRTTLTAECRRGAFRFFGEIYDSRTYGAEVGSSINANDVNVFEPVQAYVGYDIERPFGRAGKASINVGRMMLNLGSRRLVAADDYRNTTSSYTGVRADIALKNGFAATGVIVAPQFRLPDSPAAVRDNRWKLDHETTGLLLWGGLASAPAPMPGGAKVEVSFFGLRERDSAGRPTRDRKLSTVALRLQRPPKARQFDYDLEVIGQTGTLSDGLAANARRLDVAAGFVHADAGYQFADPWRTRLSAEVDWASGDGPGDKYGRFDTLFGMRRAEFAPSGILAAIGRANIASPGVRAEIAPNARLDAFIAARRMLLASRTDSFSTTGVRDARGVTGRHAGDLVDSRVRYWLVPQVLRLEADYAFIAKGRFLREAPNAPAGGDTHYLSLNATWNF
jgi:hypothetical protein